MQCSTYWGIFGSLKSTETAALHDYVTWLKNWGIFGSLKSTETWSSSRFQSCWGRLRNFRLAEEHWNATESSVSEFSTELRNFRLAEEHWNLVRAFDVDIHTIIEEFSARWRALKRCDVHLWRNDPTHWGIFGSLKSTETVARKKTFRLSVSIEEFSARWRALKLNLSRWLACSVIIEEFSARWRALKRTKLLTKKQIPPNWGIFGSLKSTETQMWFLSAPRRHQEWGIFGSLKSTETNRAVLWFCLCPTIEEFSARWRALKLQVVDHRTLNGKDWGIFGSLKSTETAQQRQEQKLT